MADRFLNAIEVAELAATPSTPSSGYRKVYPKSDGKFYTLDSSGNEVLLISNEFGIGFSIGDGSAVLTVGTKLAYYIPFACTILEWTLGSVDSTSGSVQLDLWVDSHANFPPTVADTITASAKPLFSSTTKGQSSTLTGWTTAIAAGSWLYINVDSVTSIKYLAGTLKLKRT